MTNKEPSINWNEYRFGRSIDCTFTPRESWQGAGLKPGAEKLKGREMCLSVAWLMDEDDKYPGEYALEGADDQTRDLLHSLDATWVASGDVTPTPT